MNMGKVEIEVETDAEFKAKCDVLFAKLGVSTEEAISVFLHQAVMEQGFPFRVGRRAEPPILQKPIPLGAGKIIHIFGRPNSGKTTLRNALASRHPYFNNFSIDDFRRRYGDGTLEGEIRAQYRFLSAKLHGNGFYESSGTGNITEHTMGCLRGEEVYIIVLEVPDEVCISRIDPHKYDGIPFPFFENSKEDFIIQVGRFLHSWEFERMCRGYKVLRLDGMIPLDQQVAQVERFTGIQDPAGQRYGIQLPTFRN